MASQIGRFPRLFRGAKSIPGLTWPTIVFKDELSVMSRKSLKQVYDVARHRMDPRDGKYPIYEHCIPFDVSRAYDEAHGIKRPRVWTAERDRETWKAIA